MKRYIGASLVLALVVILSPSYPQFSDSGSVAGQKRVTRRNATSSGNRKAAVDYSRFSHATKEHKESCKTCHKTPTANWKKVSEFPDVADFPDHEACVRCHRAQFFKSPQPAICSNCHLRTSPRDSARFVFRNPVASRQFTMEFPHDKHQDVIARLEPPAHQVTQTVSLRFAHSRLRIEPSSQTILARYNNCEICHVATTRPPAAPSAGWTDGFVPAANLFKAAPESHDACFSCHWKSQKPTRDSCEGCHKLAKPYLPSGVPERKSLKFTHAREQHVKECAACHINITKSASLKGLKPDVPITACSECHNKEGLRLDVGAELIALDKNRAFVCVYCHTSEIGRLNPPSSHYLIAGRAPAKPRDAK